MLATVIFASIFASYAKNVDLNSSWNKMNRAEGVMLVP